MQVLHMFQKDEGFLRLFEWVLKSLAREIKLRAASKLGRKVFYLRPEGGGKV